MPGSLTAAIGAGPPGSPGEILLRLLVALALGGVVAWTYRRTRAENDVSPSFSATLVLLAILIAMVTQVVGDNIARAFSLVGALSIVRFRTVVRDTQDTAFVIFSVVVGMAVGANDPWVAGLGILVVAAAAFLLKRSGATAGGLQQVFELKLRLDLGVDAEALLGRQLDEHLAARRLLSIGTAKQEALLNVVYEARLRPAGSPAELLHALCRVDGVRGVELQRRRAAPKA